MSAAWVPCDDCDEWFCLIHSQHVHECDCPPLDEWEIDPYTGIPLPVDNTQSVGYLRAMEMTQRRAAVGGEFGANGEWYEGGKFIATKDNPKSSPVEARPRDTARDAAMAEAARRLSVWLDARRERFASLIADLTAQPADSTLTPAQWANCVENHQAGFLASMGRDLYTAGNLTARQAESVAKAVIGRSRKTADAFDTLVSALTEEFQ